jgi:hypothetical protein
VRGVHLLEEPRTGRIVSGTKNGAAGDYFIYARLEDQACRLKSEEVPFGVG